MSRRSILLATTFSVALVSLTAVAPASAHGFGGFGGGGSFAFRPSAYGSVARMPMPPMSRMGGRFGGPAAAGVIMGPNVEPPRTSGTLATPGNTRYPVGGDAGRVSNVNSVETGGRLPKTGGSEGIPNVTGAPKVYGQGPTPDHGPGTSVVPSNGPAINLPGTQGLGQKGQREVPGYGNVGNGPQVNLPGSVDRHAPDEAAKALSKAEDNGKQLLDEVGKGGPNSVNLPTSPGAGVDVSDDTNGKKSCSGGGGSGKSGSSGSGGNTGKTTGGSAGSGSSIVVAPGVAGSNGSGPTKDGGTQTVSTMQIGSTTYQVVTVKDKDKNIVSVTYLEKGKDGKIIEKTTGPEIPKNPSKKTNETPNDDDSSTIGSLNPSSGVGKTGHGGGTDNNGTETTTQASQLNGSVVGRTGHGDGTGNHGDNNTVDKSGALSANSSLARKDYGDGGGSDNRDGGTSLAAPKVGGGDPHQKAAAAAALSD